MNLVFTKCIVKHYDSSYYIRNEYEKKGYSSKQDKSVFGHIPTRKEKQNQPTCIIGGCSLDRFGRRRQYANEETRNDQRHHLWEDCNDMRKPKDSTALLIASQLRIAHTFHVIFPGMTTRRW